VNGPEPRGMTPAELARALRVGRARIMSWIKTGELPAVNTADPGRRPRYVILPRQLAGFLASRRPSPPPARRPGRLPRVKDWFPDL
jgi:hypothetical protein